MNIKKILTLTLLIVLFSACKKDKPVTNFKMVKGHAKWAAYDEGYPITTKEVDERAPYTCKDYLEYYSDFYKGKKTPPPFDYNIDLSNKSFNELRFLRAEILARHNYLFMDYVLRAHFNTTNWYQPVFWYENFKIKLNDKERKFIDKVVAREQELYRKSYIVIDGRKQANLSNVVNWQQFEKIPGTMTDHLRRDGFVINKSFDEQLFNIYDKNYYDFVPHFVTTDLFLQVMHMHISKEMQAIEQDKMIPLLNGLLSDQLSRLRKESNNAQQPAARKAAQWVQTYYAVAASLLNGNKTEPAPSLKDQYAYEVNNINSEEGQISVLLGDSLIDYSQFKPRGNYTRTDSLKRYFKCVKWLNYGRIFIDNNDGLSRAVTMAYTLLHSKGAHKQYQALSDIIAFLSGDENNLSLVHLMNILNQYPSASLDQLLAPDKMAAIRSALSAADPRKFALRAADPETARHAARKNILFTAGRYTFDGEILQRLIHVTKPNPKRIYPKALDIFATMGNKTAENILLNTYKEGVKWTAYTDSLRFLQNKFRSFNLWDKNIYNKTMQTVLSHQNMSALAPCFMQNPGWQKKNLNTMLGSWTGLKHDMILYTEQPSGAEMGDGEEIPPPQHIAYVEPQIEVWKNCIALLKLNEHKLVANGLLSAKLKEKNHSLIDLAAFLLKISEKELHKKEISTAEFDRLSRIGGEIESLTLSIIESSEGFMSSVATPDRYMAIAADVYSYKSPDGMTCLEEAVGLADEIYVIAEINGLLYLTRGAVFSHYEFISPTRLTDEEWQNVVLKQKEPQSASWINDIKIKTPSLKVTKSFNLF